MNILPTIYITPEVERMAVMTLVSTLIHITIFYGMGFSVPEASRLFNPTMEVILVQSRSEKTPTDADYLAQASQEGGGESDKKVRPSTPTLAPFPDQTAKIVATPLPQASAAPSQEADFEHLAVHRPSTHQVAPAENVISPAETGMGTELEEVTSPEELPENNTVIYSQSELTSQQSELSSTLEERAKRRHHTYNHSPETKEKAYVAYIEAWRLKVQRVGTSHYRKEAERRKISGAGKLIVDIAIREDGTIDEITVDEEASKLYQNSPSNIRFLEEMVRQSAYEAAPYEPFPEAIREKTYILHITRKWDFIWGDLTTSASNDISENLTTQ